MCQSALPLAQVHLSLFSSFWTENQKGQSSVPVTFGERAVVTPVWCLQIPSLLSDPSGPTGVIHRQFPSLAPEPLAQPKLGEPVGCNHCGFCTLQNRVPKFRTCNPDVPHCPRFSAGTSAVSKFHRFLWPKVCGICARRGLAPGPPRPPGFATEDRRDKARGSIGFSCVAFPLTQQIPPTLRFMICIGFEVFDIGNLEILLFQFSLPEGMQRSFGQKISPPHFLGYEPAVLHFEVLADSAR